MHFQPVLLTPEIFSAEDKKEILEIVSDEKNIKGVDDEHARKIGKSKKLTKFAEKLVPVARKIFDDSTLKPTYSVILTYGKDSHLTFHKDQNACVYTIDYCVSANVVWPLVVEEKEFSIPEGQALAFMGGHDLHGRRPIPDADNPEVVNIMFHFCPEDHWYFTEGPEYIRVLMDQGKLESY